MDRKPEFYTLYTQNGQQKAEFDEENARVEAELDAVNAELATTRAEHDEENARVRAELDASRREANNVRRHNAAMHDLVGQFRRRLQYFAERGEAGHNDLLQIVSFILF